jgi:4-diphosphocytidyl-2-C-methyl-D-erythritol kinase
MSVRVFAPAKINLTLEVGARRTDGYHPLQSAVMFADAGDWIEAAPADDLSLAIAGPFADGLAADESNLVLRAARLLGSRQGARLRLEKNLPVASGIGGGSADAAATLLALNQLWGLGLSADALADMAKQLGADVPVCLRKHSAWITGAGELVAPLRAPRLDAVLVNPGKPLSTPAVYRRFDELGLGSGFTPRPSADWANAQEAFSAVMKFGNDLEAPANSLLPELAPLLATLRGDPRVMAAGLSGSGATCFALTSNAEAALELAAVLASQNNDWWVRATALGAS